MDLDNNRRRVLLRVLLRRVRSVPLPRLLPVAVSALAVVRPAHLRRRRVRLLLLRAVLRLVATRPRRQRRVAAVASPLAAQHPVRLHHNLPQAGFPLAAQQARAPVLLPPRAVSPLAAVPRQPPRLRLLLLRQAPLVAWAVRQVKIRVCLCVVSLSHILPPFFFFLMRNQVRHRLLAALEVLLPRPRLRPHLHLLRPAVSLVRTHLHPLPVAVSPLAVAVVAQLLAAAVVSPLAVAMPHPRVLVSRDRARYEVTNELTSFAVSRSSYSLCSNDRRIFRCHDRSRINDVRTYTHHTAHRVCPSQCSGYYLQHDGCYSVSPETRHGAHAIIA